MSNPWRDAFAEGDVMIAQLGNAIDLAAATTRTRQTTEAIRQLQRQLAEYRDAYKKMSDYADAAIDQRDAFREAIAGLSDAQRRDLTRAASDALNRNEQERKMSGQHGPIESRRQRLNDVWF